MVEFKPDEKYRKSLESATNDIEQAIYTILKKYELSSDVDIEVLQKLSAKVIFKLNEDLGGNLIGNIYQDFIFKMQLHLYELESQAKKEGN